MRKLVFHLRPNLPLNFVADDGKRASVLLKAIDVSEEGADWDLFVTEEDQPQRLIEASHGETPQLHSKWRDSWIALCTPIRFFVNQPDSEFYPEFVVQVPMNVRLEVPKSVSSRSGKKL